MDTLSTTDPAAALWQAVGEFLDGKRHALLAELRHYPQPIAGCDQQFTYLSEQRDEIVRELERLDAVRESCNSQAESLKIIAEFIASSPHIDGEAEGQIRAAARPQ